MKKILIIICLAGIAILGGLYAKHKYYDPRHRLEIAKSEAKRLISEDRIRDGDIIFQVSVSSQSKAIQLATRSVYSHCGLIYKIGPDFYVFEAVQPVKLTPLEKWIARGKDEKYVVKRLKNAAGVLTDSVVAKMKRAGNSFAGKNYDLTFEWSDDKIYCSELVWKIYQRATGIEIGRLGKLKDFDLSDEIVKTKMRERYGNNIPLEDTVISPAAIFNSDLLTTVASD